MERASPCFRRHVSSQRRAGLLGAAVYWEPALVGLIRVFVVQGERTTLRARMAQAAPSVTDSHAARCGGTASGCVSFPMTSSPRLSPRRASPTVHRWFSSVAKAGLCCPGNSGGEPLRRRGGWALPMWRAPLLELGCCVCVDPIELSKRTEARSGGRPEAVAHRDSGKPTAPGEGLHCRGRARNPLGCN